MSPSTNGSVNAPARGARPALGLSLLALLFVPSLARAQGDGGTDALPAALANTAIRPGAIPPPVGGTPAERLQWLGQRIDAIIEGAPLAGAKIGIAVAELESGKLLYSRNEKALLNPASNAKLVTTAAALALMGPEFRWRTALVADKAKGGDVAGDLYVRGNGDPTLTTEDLGRLVSLLVTSGIKRVGGAVMIDDTAFDAPGLPPAFEQKQEDSIHRVPAGAVALNHSTCQVHILPGPRDGAPARVVIDPPSPYFVIVNQAKTISKGRAELTIESKEIEGHTQIVVAGQVRTGAAERVDAKRVAHADLYAGWTLRELLIKRGVKVVGEVGRGAAPTSAKALSSVASPPLGVVVREINKTSNNFMAEQLLRTLGAEAVGRPGTYAKGVEAVGRYLEGIGITQGRYRMLNGSGLYDADRYTAQQFVDLLRVAYHDFRYASDFVGSLAIAGADGTIGKRMEGGPALRHVRAKTGTLAGASALSGYAGAPGKVPLVFSLLLNELSEGGATEARKAQDAIAESLVIYLQSDLPPPPETVSPTKK